MPNPARPSDVVAWGLFGAASLAAVLCGVVAVGSGPTSLIVRQVGAWAAGLLIALALSRLSGRRSALAVLVIAAVAVAATFGSAGLEGVHRWATFGPVRFNVAELCLPAAVVALGRLGFSALTGAIGAIIAILLTLQPDASQTGAFAAGVIALTALSGGPILIRFLAAAIPAACAVGVWWRPDPLKPIHEVEGVIGMAYAVAPALAVVAVLSLALAVATPLAAMQRRPSERRAAASGLTAYLTLSAITPLFGAFPVPLVGMGVSSILGAWLGIGLLLDAAKQQPD